MSYIRFEDVEEAWVALGRPHTVESSELARQEVRRWYDEVINAAAETAFNEGYGKGYDEGWVAGDEAGFAEGLDHNR